MYYCENVFILSVLYLYYVFILCIVDICICNEGRYFLIVLYVLYCLLLSNISAPVHFLV